MKTYRIETEVWQHNGGHFPELVKGPTFEVQADNHLGATMPLVRQGYKCAEVRVLEEVK